MVMRPQLEGSVIKFDLCALQGYKVDGVFAFYVLFVFFSYFMQVEKVGFEIFIFSHFFRLPRITLSGWVWLHREEPSRMHKLCERTHDLYFWIWTLTHTVRSQKRQQLSITLCPPSGFRRRGHHQAVKVLLMVIHEGQYFEIFQTWEQG